MGEIDKKLLDSGIKFVIVNDTYYDAIDRLSEAYPEIRFIRADKISELLLEKKTLNSP